MAFEMEGDTVRNIEIRRATEKDAPVIAQAVAMAIGHESSVNYCGENYLEVLTEVAQLAGTQYSYANSLVASVDGEPAGALCGYDGAALDELRAGTLAVVNKYNPLDGPIDDETQPGEFYLDSIGVLPAYRGLGIGSMLINAMTETARNEGYGRIGLIVDFDNPKAEKLYARLGFRRAGTRMFFGHKMWHLQKTIEQ